MNSFVISPSDETTKALAAKDSQMKKLINHVGNVVVPMRPDYFRSLVRSIVGQQISVKAAETVFGRLETLVDGRMTPDQVSQISDEALRTAGLSRRKTTYLRHLTQKIHDNTIHFADLPNLTNEEVVKQLTIIKGIGKWTAEMFLIFSLARMDVLAVDDVGLQRGAKWLYHVDKTRRRQILLDKQAVWEPHLTIASVYLWEVVHLGYDKTGSSIDDLI